MFARWLFAIPALLAARTATAEPARVDWARGLVIANAVGIADRHAPSPAVARGTARRGAEDVARAALTAALPGLPLAAGGTLADKLGDPAIKSRVDRAVAEAVTVDAEPETDGAWRVSLAVPTEAIRIALAGDRAWPGAADAGDAGPPIVIIDGAGAAVPALGWTLTVGGAALAAPIVFARSAPPAAAKAPHVRASSARGGVIALGDAGGATAATLFVVVKSAR